MRILTSPSFTKESLNPYLWLLYNNMGKYGVSIEGYSIKKVLFKKFSVWHLHWPEAGLNSRYFPYVLARVSLLLFLLFYARLRGTKIIWTIHNLNAHESFYSILESLFWQIFIDQLDGYISLSKIGEKIAIRQFPKLKDIQGFVIPHGHYKEVYPNLVNKKEARKRLRILNSTKVLLFLGQIRRYKNVLHLTRIFQQISDSNLILLVAGKPVDSSLARKLKSEAKKDTRICLYLNFIPTEDLQLYLRASDLVVLPYKEILNSGSALLSLSFNTPLLVPKKGVFIELKRSMGNEWIRTYTGELSTQDLQSAIDWAINDHRSECKALENLNWSNLAQKTLEYYKLILN